MSRVLVDIDPYINVSSNAAVGRNDLIPDWASRGAGGHFSLWLLYGQLLLFDLSIAGPNENRQII